ncbi:SMC-Scp complex subunit ScpB [Micromonospora sp. NPDC048909]|uniref:SMC-Scp complex subunit ScpB n=1 Tax=Micromonospora sp. NPDC048909 TaxID=3155643 RepID=UPI0033C753E0
MSNEERPDSLADQAAAWVPPWERPASPPTGAPADLGTDRPLEALGSAKISGDPDPEAADVGEFPGEPGGERPEAEPAAVPRPEAGPAEAPQPEAGPAAEPRPEAGPVASEQAEVGQVTAQQVTPEAVAAEQAEVGRAGNTPGGPVRQGTGRRRAAPEPAPAPVLDDAELRGALEAILLVVDEPVSELTLAQVLEQSPERVGAMLDDISAGYTASGHGFELRRAAGGWRLYTRPEYASYVERFVLEGQSVRLTQAALETLAVVAYKQPVTRSRISAIRGVNCDGVIRTLVTRGLVEECGTEAESGAFLYRTTTLFLEKLGLNTVDELPPLAPFLPDDVEELTDATR